MWLHIPQKYFVLKFKQNVELHCITLYQIKKRCKVYCNKSMVAFNASFLNWGLMITRYIVSKEETNTLKFQINTKNGVSEFEFLVALVRFGASGTFHNKARIYSSFSFFIVGFFFRHKTKACNNKPLWEQTEPPLRDKTCWSRGTSHLTHLHKTRLVIQDGIAGVLGTIRTSQDPQHCSLKKQLS